MENEDLTLDFMGYKAMCHCRPIIQRLHNKRDPKIVSSEKHIDLSRTHETILESFNQKSEQLEKDIQANTEKSLDLFIKESKLSKKEKEQSSKQSELEQQESDLQSREALVEMKESNNKYQRERNEKKELELAEREKVVELGEQKNEIDQKSKNAEQALKDAQTIQAEKKRHLRILN